jgi:hypothetical protein
MFSLVPVHMKRAGAGAGTVAPIIVCECCVTDQHKRKYYIDVKEKLEIANLSMFYTLETYLTFARKYADIYQIRDFVEYSQFGDMINYVFLF